MQDPQCPLLEVLKLGKQAVGTGYLVRNSGLQERYRQVALLMAVYERRSGIEAVN